MLQDAASVGHADHWVYQPILVYASGTLCASWLVGLVVLAHTLLSATELAQDAYVVWLTTGFTSDRSVRKIAVLVLF